MVVLSQLHEESSSSSTQDYRYDVFLSFRGRDTRLSFTDHLHMAFLNANITTFLDDEDIETGLSLKPELESAIRASRASIIVLSQNYASSTWCLDELVLILEQHRNSDHVVIPIFYHVDPTDVRKQQSTFGDAMADHKQRMETKRNVEKRSHWAQKMKLWSKALTEVADLKGKNAKDRKETELIEEIVADIRSRLGVPLKVTLPLLIGVDHHIRFITSWLKDGSSCTADILTILGMGGIGKTSLAKYVFGLHSREFQRSSFIEDISRKCAQEQYNGLHDLQKNVCSDISKTSSIQVHDVSVYTSQIENALSRKKVFLVLDGVDSLDHLYPLLGKKGFHPGSKIIITTKDASLTDRYVVFYPTDQPKHMKCSLEGLDKYESLKLLSFHAFMCHKPKESHMEVSKKLVKYCGGHPLALEVLGKSLCNRDVAEWEDYIESLKEETDSHVTKVLQMSFNSLPSKNDKELFKHIACFFVGKDKDSIQAILNACGIRTVLGIQNLIDRCLLSIGEDKTLRMHQLVQEMGRDVVRQESPNKPWKRSRLWCHEESFKVLKQKKVKGNLLGLALDMSMLEKEKTHESYELKTDALSKMDNLMLLQLNYVQVRGSYKNFPKELKWLCMHGFPLKSIPCELPIENLVALDMSYSNFESFDMSYSSTQQSPKRKSWLNDSSSKEKGSLRSLKILNLSFCKQLHSIGGFSKLPTLERLILANCTGLVEVSESIDKCLELILIDLSHCSMLQKLPMTLVKLKKVKTLLLNGCDLGASPIEIRDPEMLKAENISINSKTYPSAIVETVPRALQSSLIFLPKSLVSLSLANSKLSNRSFPMDFSCLSKLKNLDLSGNPIISLPNCVRSLAMLEKLNMHRCNILKTVVHPPRTLRQLNIKADNLNSEPCLRKIEFDQEMSPLDLGLNMPFSTSSPFEIEGLVKVEAMADASEDVLRSLGWTNLDFTKNQQVEIRHSKKTRQVQLDYEFGIFSTCYVGTEIPNWISHRSNVSSLLFTIPLSANKFRGLNLCYILDDERNFISALGRMDPLRRMDIHISNITKNRTWIYRSHRVFDLSAREGTVILSLSHWMFGNKEMENGDQVAIDIGASKVRSEMQCGVSFVYDEDDGKNKMEEEEEDPLGYYKSWNHIIGGDLSPMRRTNGEYFLYILHFFRGWGFSGRELYIEKQPRFRAFS